MKETLDVWVIVPRRVAINRIATILECRFFFTLKAAEVHLRQGDTTWQASQLVCKATLTMEADDA